MVRRSFCAGLICLAITSVGIAGYPTNRFSIRIPNQKYSAPSFLAVVDGRLALTRSSLGRVPDKSDALDRWYIEGTRIKCSVGGGYLAYDPAGKDPGVIVVAQPPDGVEWKVTLRRREGSERGVLEAATGEMKGWSLDIEDPPSPPPGVPPTPAAAPGRIILSKEPRLPFVVERIYGHK